jgi:hypothetical protein
VFQREENILPYQRQVIKDDSNDSGRGVEGEGGVLSGFGGDPGEDLAADPEAFDCIPEDGQDA